ncbi:hypothetical protein Acy02nite_51120 [Actinoplanes cyaneus]|uniref:Uncharacterized protein n=1 Tax=Actinoplanes cyaneus TaxID=52696 RepID=A0A919ILF9_9ACTN|nr:hypothetical protein [Actinoplanes cyaneus]MCW2141168.1 hypothetical protein [Actinoplanes cyaneus]GID67231.1 hypothetical protein Acy02nite_51120 [Actinoplanes cyaneus]
MFITDSHRSRRAAPRAAPLITAALVLGLIGGCGAGNDDASSSAPGVASLQSPAAGTPTATARATSAERPLIREDASEEEKVRLRDIYVDCMWENGFPKQDGMKGPNGGYPSNLDDFDLGPGVVERIEKNCAAKEPESPFDRARRLDPAFDDHVRANVKCLNDHGIKAVVQDGAPALVDGLPSRSKSHLLDDCEREAFADYYSTLK